MERFTGTSFGDFALLEELYESYQADPDSVDPSWRDFFQQIDQGEELPPLPSKPPPKRQPTAVREEPAEVRTIYVSSDSDARIHQLVDAYRSHGHLAASVNPIATEEVTMPPELELDALGFGQDELQKVFRTDGVCPEAEAPLERIISTLQTIYSSNVGVEYMHIRDLEMRRWLQERIEPAGFDPQLSIDAKRMILQHLNKSELFESFLHTKYVGQKRFSLEGEGTLIPMLYALYQHSATLGTHEIVLGMAHRGRLNVLVNILDKSYGEVFGEFEDSFVPQSFQGSGDVKYHKGYSSEVTTEAGHAMKISLTSNPSHLEAVSAVVAGQVRAKQASSESKDPGEVIPVLIHGDAAIAGQGIVYETLQLGGLKGYSVGGTIHVIVNNQIGFTTLPHEGRSTRYCTAIAKAFNAPIFHLNVEDPEGCFFVTELAVEMRQRFHCDVFLELNGYRKYGHNESDEPAFTQPLEYKLIRPKKPIREAYRDNLIQQGVLERYMAETLEEEFKKALNRALKGIQVEGAAAAEEAPPKSVEGFFAAVDTKVSKELITEVLDHSLAVPDGFNVHPKLLRQLEDRRAVVKDGDRSVDWALAEQMAFGTLLREGTNVRLSGQDSRRGTFSQRHAMWVDQENATKYFPLSHLSEEQGLFEVVNSPLSEYGVLGFEFGYSIADPDSLVIWEAQFGDFANAAQIIIDQFISTAEQKWGVKSGLVLFLPHGFEGQGSEHSSARIERFMSLCGNYNMAVMYPSTPAQLFHLLRRQIKRPEVVPAVVFTPKGLLRHPQCVSSLDDFSQGAFQEIIDDTVAPDKVERVVLCTGRIFYDLMEARERFGVEDMAIVRVEQLYPLHMTRLKEIIGKYNRLKGCYWVQEEPSNMGAWKYLRALINAALPSGMHPKYIGRPPSASPATGSFNRHKKQHVALINAVFQAEEQPFYEMSYHTAPA